MEVQQFWTQLPFLAVARISNADNAADVICNIETSLGEPREELPVRSPLRLTVRADEAVQQSSRRALLAARFEVDVHHGDVSIAVRHAEVQRTVTRNPAGLRAIDSQFRAQPGTRPLACGIIGDFFDAVWGGQSAGAMNDVAISGRSRAGRGPRNRPPLEPRCLRKCRFYVYLAPAVRWPRG